MLRKLMTKKRALVLGVVAVLALAGGAAAYFTSSGTGTGSASVGKVTAFTVAVASDESGSLYPGSGSEELGYTVENPGPGSQRLHKTTATLKESGGAIVSEGSAVPGCAASWFTLENQPPGETELVEHTTASGSVVVRMKNEPESQNACQGKKPEVIVEAS